MAAPPVLAKQYAEQRNGAYWISGTRLSLDSVIYAFLSGASPESIVQSFPLLTLEQVYGAIAFYLTNKEVIDAYLKEGEEIFRRLQQSARNQNADFYAKFESSKTISQ
jgi:uncharacterized protein (DUF433 family)